jgi:hypothetical protein
MRRWLRIGFPPFCEAADTAAMERAPRVKFGQSNNVVTGYLPAWLKLKKFMVAFSEVVV